MIGRLLRRRRLPRYVRRGGEQVHAHPLFARDCRVHAFPLRANRSALARLCARDFSEPSRGRIQIEPLGDRVLVAVAQLGEIGSRDPTDGPKGIVRELDLAIWIPVARVRRIGHRRLVRRIGWFLPWIFVDHPWATIAGRESNGLPKQVTRFAVQEDEHGLERLVASTEVLHRYAPDCRAAERPILELQRGEALPKQARDPVGLGRSLVGGGWFPQDGAGRLMLPAPGLLGQAVDIVARRRVPLLSLKQFRDIRFPERACFQAVSETPCRAEAVHQHGPIEHAYRLTIHDHDSHRILEELGIGSPSPERGAQTLDLEPGWRVHFDFEFSAGRDLWRWR